MAIAGLALLGTIGNSLYAALSDEAERNAALLTFFNDNLRPQPCRYRQRILGACYRSYGSPSKAMTRPIPVQLLIAFYCKKNHLSTRPKMNRPSNDSLFIQAWRFNC